MNGVAAPDVHALLVLLVGLSTVAAMAVKTALERVGLPPLVGFIAIGLALATADRGLPLLTPAVMHGFDLLASLGLVALLFRVGLGAHAGRLLAKLPRAALIWLGNVAVSAIAGYALLRWALAWPLIPSLVATVALTATSIGVAVPIWQDNGALDSDSGTLTVDVAELDDISGVVLMALLFATLPALRDGGDIWANAWTAGVTLLASLAAFAAFCWLFAHLLEQRLARAVARWEQPAGRMLTVAGLGAMIAAVAGALGFSLAVGALFAGLVFSAAPHTVRREEAYRLLYDFLTPFFFIGIGLRIDPTALGSSLALGGALLLVAVAGKLAGSYLPARLSLPPRESLLVAVSMVPRAEIAMVILHQGHQLGAWAVPDALYGAMAIVTMGTCLVTPPVLQRLLRGHAPR